MMKFAESLSENSDYNDSSVKGSGQNARATVARALCPEPVHANPYNFQTASEESAAPSSNLLGAEQ